MNVMHEGQHSRLFGAIASFLLGLVQRLIGGPYEICRCGDPVWDGARESETDGHGIAIGVFDFGFADFPSECIRDLCRSIHRSSRQHNNELVPSISRDQVAWTIHMARNKLCNLPETFIAGLMAMAVVIGLEEINIEHNQREGSRFARGWETSRSPCRSWR